MDPTSLSETMPTGWIPRLASWIPDGESISEITALPGGGNNRVFRVATRTGAYLLKWYFSSSNDLRDRWRAEWVFSNFAWEHGLRQLPQPIAADKPLRIALFQFIEGRRLAADEIGAEHIQAATAFLEQLNQFRDLPAAAELGLASEACLSYAEHLRRVTLRVDQLCQETPANSEKSRAFVQEALRPALVRVTDNLRGQLSTRGLDESRAISGPQRILSPSDFGFHNALLDHSGRLRFFDFEYAGWDDPAKTACDFFSQVAVPVPSVYWPDFLACLCKLAGPEVAERAELLLPLYRIKWCCIILNSLLRTGRERRAFSTGSASSAGEATCLDEAHRMLSRIGESHGR